MAMALDGITVLDLTQYPPGQYCTVILGDLGADVLKVESPPTVRFGAPWKTGTPGDEDLRRAAFNALDRNKRSIVLDLKNPDALAVFRDMATQSDVIVEGFRPGVARRLGIDYDQVAAINPRVVYCSLTGYGQDGPYHNLPGHDINYLAVAGVLGLIGKREGAPIVPLNLVGDFAGGSLFAVIGILTALLARERTGEGQYVDAAICDGALSLLSFLAANLFGRGKVPSRGTSNLGGGYPYYGAYQTADGKYISIGAAEPWFWERLCRVLGREDFIPYCAQESHGFEAAGDGPWEEIRAWLESAFRAKSRDEWFELLSKADVPAAPVLDLEEVFADAHIRQRAMLVEVPNLQCGTVRQVGIPVKLSKTPGQVRRLAPARGQDSAEILASLGYTREKIAKLLQTCAVS